MSSQGIFNNQCEVSPQVYGHIKKYAEMMMGQEYSVEKGRLLVKLDSGIFATKLGWDLTNLTEDGIQTPEGNYIEERLIMEDNDINALVISSTPFCQRCISQGVEIQAVLDDMAQIVGPTVSIVEYNKKAIIAALKKSACVLVKDKYTISTGRNLYEAVVAMTVLEKSAEVLLKAEVLGGGKPINIMEAKLMRTIYKKKYSKAEQSFKALEEEI